MQGDVNKPKITCALRRNVAGGLIDFAEFNVLEAIALAFDFLQIFNAKSKVFRNDPHVLQISW